ncbi:hypothetical protein ACP6EU_05960 [Acinetobacter baumannii]|uniref:hypothetical protein n=1 Tax=Acinetobacter baumannii TaxID=470 RepID=UPI003CF51ED8
MKPEKFIREYGVEKAREVVEGAPDRTASHYVVDTDTYYSEDFLTYFDYSLDDWETADLNSIDELKAIYELVIDLRILKRLVESVDLVQHMGGISEVKRKFRDNGSCHGNRMKAIIADYESIYGEGNE